MQDDPKNVELINNYAFTLQESGDLSGAEAEFRKALSVDSSFENAAVNLGLLLARQQRDDEALEILSPAIGEAAAHHNLGVVAIDSGDGSTRSPAIRRSKLVARGLRSLANFRSLWSERTPAACQTVKN